MEMHEARFYIESGRCLGLWLKQRLVAFKRILDSHEYATNGEYGSFSSRKDKFNLASCSAQTLWAERACSIVVLFCVPNCKALVNSWSIAFIFDLLMKGRMYLTWR